MFIDRRRLDIVETVIISKSSYTFSAICIYVPPSFVTAIDKLVIKFI
jgi:hypothetical protein